MSNLENNDANDQGEVFYPPELFNVNQGVGGEFKKRFLDFIKATDAEIALIKNTIYQLKERKGGKPVIISLSNFKGGVGKTTTTFTLAQFLTNIGINVMVMDTDKQFSSYMMLNNRKIVLTEYLRYLSAEKNSVEAIQAVKDNLDPVCACTKLDFKDLLAEINNVAETGRYDVIIIDTPGYKNDTISNFSISGINNPDTPHSFTAFISDAVIIPSQTSSLDKTTSIQYYVELEEFVKHLMFKKFRNNLVYKLLATRVGDHNEISYLEMQEQMRDNGVSMFKNCFRNSKKFTNTVTDHTYETFFTKNNASIKTIEFKELVIELAESLQEKMQQDDFVAQLQAGK